MRFGRLPLTLATILALTPSASLIPADGKSQPLPDEPVPTVPTVPEVDPEGKAFSPPELDLDGNGNFKVPTEELHAPDPRGPRPYPNYLNSDGSLKLRPVEPKDDGWKPVKPKRKKYDFEKEAPPAPTPRPERLIPKGPPLKLFPDGFDKPPSGSIGPHRFPWNDKWQPAPDSKWPDAPAPRLDAPLPEISPKSSPNPSYVPNDAEYKAPAELIHLHIEEDVKARNITKLDAERFVKFKRNKDYKQAVQYYKDALIRYQLVRKALELGLYDSPEKVKSDMDSYMPAAINSLLKTSIQLELERRSQERRQNEQRFWNERFQNDTPKVFKA